MCTCCVSEIPVDNQCVTVKSTGVVLEDEEEKIGVYNVLEDSILVLTIQGTIYTGPPKAPIEDYKAHPRISFTGGTLLSQKGKYLIADWIEEEYIEHPRLKFVLTYKGTKHGFSCSRFHEICDSEGCPCVVMVQSTNGNIFGGYTTHSWRLNNHYREGLFMFTVFDKNKNRIKEPTKFRLKKKKAVYVRCKETAGPIFGDLRDLYIANDCNKYAISFCQLGRSYGFPEGFQKANNLKDTTKVFLAARRRFKVAEIEVYMI